MELAIENLRLRELALIAEQNHPIFDDLVGYLQEKGYSDLHDFVVDADEEAAYQTILGYLHRPLPQQVELLDGVARPYKADRAKWLLLGWIFRDAPSQRLEPMLRSMPGETGLQRRAALINKVRLYVADIFPEPERWEWTSISEVIIDRLEGSRRAIKGTLFEAIVRRILEFVFEENNIPLVVNSSELRIKGETYDVSVKGSSGQILIPVKTRETMGGGHALLFTRDIHKSIAVAHGAGFECLPIVIAESWGGDLSALNCKDFICINMNPNRIKELEPLLLEEVRKRVPSFLSVI